MGLFFVGFFFCGLQNKVKFRSCWFKAKRIIVKTRDIQSPKVHGL